MYFQKNGRVLMPIKCSDLISENPVAWEHATKHPFLDQCQSGAIKPDQFNIWLVQDHLFVVLIAKLKIIWKHDLKVKKVGCKNISVLMNSINQHITMA